MEFYQNRRNKQELIFYQLKKIQQYQWQEQELLAVLSNEKEENTVMYWTINLLTGVDCLAWQAIRFTEIKIGRIEFHQ